MAVDVAAVREPLDYVLPRKWRSRAEVGTRVRVPLHGREVEGWIVGFPEHPSTTESILSVIRMLGYGPDEDTVRLCEWASLNWVGSLAGFLAVASPPRQVRSLASIDESTTGAGDLEHTSGGGGSSVVRIPPSGLLVTQIPPAAPMAPLLSTLMALGPMLCVAPTQRDVLQLSREVRSLGGNPAIHPVDWERAAEGAHVIGTRSSVFARCRGLSSILVMDEHDEAHQNQSSPTWNARDVAVRRGEELGIPVVLSSPTPSLEARAVALPERPSRSRERDGWARLLLLDRSDEDAAREGLFSPPLVRELRRHGRCLCVLNRLGRSSMLACNACRSLIVCDRCGTAVHQTAEGILACRQCHRERPPVCLDCASGSFRLLRIGVTRAREELQALLREPVGEVTGSRRRSSVPEERVLIGTEALLTRVADADLVAFVDFDQIQFFPRYRAAERALAILASASRIVGGRRPDAQVVLQTRQPGSVVLAAASRADPDLVAESELRRRELLRMPPAESVAVVGGEGGAEFMSKAAEMAGLEIEQASAGDWIIRAADRPTLVAALATVRRPARPLRLQIDPVRLPEPSV